MFNKLLDAVIERKRSRGKNLQPPCTAECLNSLGRQAKLQLGYEIPKEYANFLSEMNGLDWNGIVIYACARTPLVGYADRFIDGFIEANLDFREYEPMKDYVVFADDGVALFTWHVSNSKYEVITRVGLSSLESFRSIDELLANALAGHL
jgi:hypothetical protein